MSHQPRIVQQTTKTVKPYRPMPEAEGYERRPTTMRLVEGSPFDYPDNVTIEQIKAIRQIRAKLKDLYNFICDAYPHTRYRSMAQQQLEVFEAWAIKGIMLYGVIEQDQKDKI